MSPELVIPNFSVGSRDGIYGVPPLLARPAGNNGAGPWVDGYIFGDVSPYEGEQRFVYTPNQLLAV